MLVVVTTGSDDCRPIVKTTGQQLQSLKLNCTQSSNSENLKNLTKLKHFICNTKKGYFKKLNIKDLTDNKKFWKIIKLFFSNKGLNSYKLMLKKEDVLISDEKVLATLVSKYVFNIAADIDLKRETETLSDTSISSFFFMR